MNKLTLLLSFIAMLLGQFAFSAPLGDKNIENRWIQYTYHSPDGTADEYVAFDFRDSDSVFSQVCQYGDGTELEASVVVPIRLGYDRGEKYFLVPYDLHIVESKNGHTCELEFPQGIVYYKADPPKFGGQLSLRILIKNWGRIWDFMLRP